MKAFNDLADFSIEEIKALVELAGRLDKSPEPKALKGKVLSLLFLSPSLRTLASFQAAMLRLGGGSFVISPDMSIHGLEVRDGGNIHVEDVGGEVEISNRNGSVHLSGLAGAAVVHARDDDRLRRVPVGRVERETRRADGSLTRVAR